MNLTQNLITEKVPLIKKLVESIFEKVDWLLKLWTEKAFDLYHWANNFLENLNWIYKEIFETIKEIKESSGDILAQNDCCFYTYVK